MHADRASDFLPPRTGRRGADIYGAVAALVSNRLKQDPGGFNLGHALACLHNRDLVEGEYDTLNTTWNFSKLLNRVENRAGLSPVDATMRSADDIATLTRRFAPSFANEPAATQWDLLRRAAEVLDHAGIAERLLNRAVSTDRVRATRPESGDRIDEVSKSDWKEANEVADDVFALLDAEATQQVDRGRILAHAGASQIRGVFKRSIESLMTEQGLDRRQAFDRLKETEPIFWTLAMLSFPVEL